jgi:hypothetical protein
MIHSESNDLYNLIVAGVSSEKSAFKVFKKSSRCHFDCDVLSGNANVQKAISCNIFDQILKVRPFLNSENF